ncbi:MAG TPA: amino acid ABC transporter permease [Motilibacteraceae bacterium]|nr:amino acid ABC transporter permease [Motilibacteraceae bacterium]
MPAEAFVEVSDVQRARDSYRRSRARRASTVSVLSTLVVAALTVAIVTASPGWERTKQSFFDWAIAKEYFPSILEGLWLNLRILVVAALLILLLGLLLATLRTLRGPVFTPLRLFATVYVDVFRGMPLIILLYIVGFGVPGLRLQGVPTDAAVLGTVALVLTYSAYVAEVFRAGIESVHPSQRAAARALGLSYRQSMRLVVLPQAIRRVAPPLLNDLVALQKDVGLVSVLGAVDAVRAAQIASAETYNYTPYVMAGLVFIALAVPTVRLADWVTARARRRQETGAVL